MAGRLKGASRDRLGDTLSRLRIPQQVRLAEISTADGVYQAVAIGGLAGIDALECEDVLLRLIEGQEKASDTADRALRVHDEAIARLRAQEAPQDVLAWARGEAGPEVTPGGLKVILRSAWQESGLALDGK